MKKIIIVFVAFLALSACKKNASKNETKDVVLDTQVKEYPATITSILDAHGGIDAWNSMENLAFGMQKGEELEMTTTALKSRQSLIETNDHKLGYDGEKVWLQNKDTITYKGNAKFYYNLMFYFYAMPFVLADDGMMMTLKKWLG